MGSFKAIIIAGGSGERFWPLSTSARPKQFLSVFGGDSLIRQAVTRLKGLVASEDVYVVTAQSLVAATRRELPEVPRANVIGEPCRRDTAAAVALGVGAAGEGVLAVFPADQLVTKSAAFRAAVRKAVAAAKRTDTVVTLGIRPTFAATGYGYVDPASGRFVEKPDAATAKRYVAKGYLWNAGMFIARAEVFRRVLAEHAPALVPLAGTRWAAAGSARRLKTVYPALPKISFDYAVMEKLPHVAVVPADCGWDDAGGYGALERHFAADRDGNVALGDVTAAAARGCTAVAKGPKIALFGVKDLIVVTTPEAVLVTDKAHAADLKQLVSRL